MGLYVKYIETFWINNHSFNRWVQILYSDIQICVSNNGRVSIIFKNFRWIGQRCPLFALLFILSVEIKALRLRSNTNIKWIATKIDDKNHSTIISQLADDTTIFMSSKEEIASALNEIEIFGSLSGLILNRHKTQQPGSHRLNRSINPLDVNIAALRADNLDSTHR